MTRTTVLARRDLSMRGYSITTSSAASREVVQTCKILSWGLVWHVNKIPQKQVKPVFPTSQQRKRTRRGHQTASSRAGIECSRGWARPCTCESGPRSWWLGSRSRLCVVPSPDVSLEFTIISWYAYHYCNGIIGDFWSGPVLNFHFCSE